MVSNATAWTFLNRFSFVHFFVLCFSYIRSIILFAFFYIYFTSVWSSNKKKYGTICSYRLVKDYNFLLAHHPKAESDAMTSPTSVAVPHTFFDTLVGAKGTSSQEWQLRKQNLKKSFVVSALVVPVQFVQPILSKFKPYMIKQSLVRPVIPYSGFDDTYRLVLLEKSISLDLKEISSQAKSVVENHRIEVIPYEVKLEYENLSAEEALEELLPKGVQVPGSFETIGHIARLNLSDSQIPYGKLIGQIFLEKKKGIRTVINKSSFINNKYRTLDFELLAGDEDYIAHLKESGLMFYIDFKNVFWNSRLNYERERVTQSIPSGDIVCDVFAGVGAFAMFLGKKNCTVFANDLNPDCVKCLDINIAQNKVSSRVASFCMGAGEFIKYMLDTVNVLNPKLSKYNEFPLFENATVHFLMHLPMTAISFLGTFVETPLNHAVLNTRRCIIHCYCFSRSDPPDIEIQERIEKEIGILPSNLTIRRVRDIAPRTQAYCAEFELPTNVLNAAPIDSVEADSNNSTSVTATGNTDCSKTRNISPKRLRSH